MNRKKLIAVIGLTTLLCFSVLGLIGCLGIVRLDAPSALSLENGAFKWDAVKNATGYVVYFNGKEYDTSTNELPLPDDTPTHGNVSVEIRSVGDGDKYVDSDWGVFSIELSTDGRDENGFEYFLKDDGYQIFRGNGSIEGKVVIPAYFKGIPVKYLAEDFFTVYGDNGNYGRMQNALTTSVVLPETLTQLEGGTFAYCANLTEINIPSGITVLEGALFYNCSSLKKIDLPKNLKKISDQCFKNCALEEIVFPEGLEEIGFESFESRVEPKDPAKYNGAPQAFKEITIPKSIKSIGTRAFKNCKNLEKINLSSDNLVSFGEEVFKGTKWYNDHADGWVILDGLLYSYKGILDVEEVTLLKPITKIAANALSSQPMKKVTVCSGVELIGSAAFSKCNLLEEVVFQGDFETLPSSTFSNCTNLKSVTLPSNLKTIDLMAFRACKNLTEIVLPETVTDVTTAFGDCTKLTHVKLPNGVSELSTAFNNCANLQYIVLPKSVTFIDRYAFSRCNALKTIFYEGAFEEWNNVKTTDDFTLNDVTGEATVYFFSETAPKGDGNYWHYVNNVPTPW